MSSSLRGSNPRRHNNHKDLCTLHRDTSAVTNPIKQKSDFATFNETYRTLSLPFFLSIYLVLKSNDY